MCNEPGLTRPRCPYASCAVAPPLVLGSPDIGEGRGSGGVRWDGLRGGQGFGVPAFPPAPGNSLWLQWGEKVNWKMDRGSHTG